MNNDSVIFAPSGGMTDVGDKNNHWLIYKGKAYGDDLGQSIPAEGESLTPSIHFPDNKKLFRAGIVPAAVFLSHLHLDHAGYTHWFYDECALDEDGNERDNVHFPEILGSDYTLRGLELIAGSQIDQDELPIVYDANSSTVPVEHGQPISVGDATYEFFNVPHSIPGSLGTIVTIGGKRIAYLGDTKLNGYTAEETRAYRNTLASLGRVDYLKLDATGVERPGSAPSDSVAVEETADIVRRYPGGRVFITLFSSHTGRQRRIIEKIRRDFPDRQIVYAGRSLFQHGELAGLQDKFVSYWRGTYDDVGVARNAVVFLTGSNGEEWSAMDRMMKGDLNGLSPREGDAVVFSASTIPVPDNQRAVTRLLRKLERTSADIHISPDVYVDPSLNGGLQVSQCHTSGHAFQDDLREIVELVNPKAIIPVHADRQRREMMRELFPERDVRLVDTGQALEL